MRMLGEAAGAEGVEGTAAGGAQGEANGEEGVSGQDGEGAKVEAARAQHSAAGEREAAARKEAARRGEEWERARSCRGQAAEEMRRAEMEAEAAMAKVEGIRILEGAMWDARDGVLAGGKHGRCELCSDGEVKPKLFEPPALVSKEEPSLDTVRGEARQPLPMLDDQVAQSAFRPV